MIEVRALFKRYGKFTAVNGIDLDVASGQVYGFLGPNGAGKTTTLRMITGMIRPSSGTIRIGGFDLADRPVDAKRITSLIPDRPYLYEKLTASEYLRFVGGLYTMPASRCAVRGQELLELFALSEWSGSLIENFSHGMKQRLVFAGALLTNPKLLVVDEPMVGLDPKGKRLVKDVFRQFCRDENKTVLLSTHTMETAQEVCDTISVINRGDIIGRGTLDELREHSGTGDGDLEAVFLKLTEEEADQTPPAAASDAAA